MRILTRSERTNDVSTRITQPHTPNGVDSSKLAYFYVIVFRSGAHSHFEGDEQVRLLCSVGIGHAGQRPGEFIGVDQAEGGARLPDQVRQASRSAA